ncbi:uncharacterized protein LOC133337435 [Musca vetustissima]|uniref:uncharacterized protein LOC133337435 n=1 Tax=Musca vetustissima TaxID=27455 RepID=UPI002AB5F4F4|nr:uncharacterized protein LOC133337435 [Musca vetustissima]
MFEKPPIWVIVVGLNVCILIWLITVQEPVMYDASTAIITSGSINNNNNNRNNLQQLNDVAAPPALQQRVGRNDRDIAPLFSGRHLSFSDVNGSSTFPTTLNWNISSSSSSNSNNISQTTRSEEIVQSTTTVTDLLANIHSLTSSLGTGVLETIQRPTPSWIKMTAVSSALPEEDFNHLIDLHDFHYLVPQPVCSSNVEALILVHSAPRNQPKRQIIRETWASIGRHMVDSPIRVLFLLGAVAEDSLQHEVMKENSDYADIIQGSFMDDYRNMTYKHVMAFKWFLYNCPDAQILIKVDDDVYVNTPQLIKYLKAEQQNENMTTAAKNAETTNEMSEEQDANKPTIITLNDTTKKTKSTKKSLYESLKNFANSLTLSSTSSSSDSSADNFTASTRLFHRPQNLLFCQKITGSLVKRSYRSKWRVSFKEYSERYYPPYCPGYAIIYSPDVVFRLYNAAQNFKYFWIDDVHITGVLAQQTNTTITTSSHYVLYSDECERLLTGKTDLQDTEFLFAWHSISAQQIKAIWHLQMMSLASPDDLIYRRSTNHNSNNRRKKSKRRQGSSFKNARLAYNITTNNNLLTTSDGFR